MLRLLTFLALVLGLTEGTLRLSRQIGLASKNPAPESMMRLAMREKVQERIDSLVFRDPSRRAHPFEPPFSPYFNTGFEDAARMKRIAEATPLQKRGHWFVPNFLRSADEAEITRYHVSTNSLGFRDHERIERKPHGVFRIIVLGSYPAFGHGVNDDETYSSQLETMLNRKFRGRPRIEVWNGGRQGTTAIMGLARLEFELARYAPDLLIWDYGWIDVYLRPDYGFTFQVLKFCGAGWASHTEICRKTIERISSNDHKTATDQWKSTNRKMIEVARSRHLSVAILRHNGVSIPRSEYVDLDDPAHGIHFIDTQEAINRAKLTDADLSAFRSRPSWLDEIHVSKESIAKDPQILCRGDAIQYNALGYRLIARFLAQQLEPIIKHE